MTTLGGHRELGSADSLGERVLITFASDTGTGPFGLEPLEQRFAPIADRFARARGPEEYRTLGTALCDVLRAFAAEVADAGSGRLASAGPDFGQWPAQIASRIFGGDDSAPRELVFVMLLTQAWDAATALSEAPAPGRPAAETAIYLCRYATEYGAHAIGRYLHQRPDVCPNCGSPHVTAVDGRARCLDCGWQAEG